MEKANETLLERVQKERIERKRKITHINAKRNLPSEIEENDITWRQILGDAGQFLIGLFGLGIFVLAVIALAFFIPA